MAYKEILKHHCVKDVELESSLQWRYKGIGDTRMVRNQSVKSAGTEQSQPQREDTYTIGNKAEEREA